MSELKTLKISEEVHAALNSRAKSLALKQGKLAEALLMAGLRMSDQQLIKIVANLIQEENGD